MREKEKRTVASAVWVLIVASSLLFGLASATAEAPQVHALTGVRIVVAPGQVIESGTVVIRDGVIAAVGADVEIPADARVWEMGDEEQGEDDGSEKSETREGSDDGAEDGAEDAEEPKEKKPVTVYPGLIDLYTELEWPLKEGGGSGGGEGRRPGGGGGGDTPAPQDVHDNSLVRPEREMSRFAADPGHAKKLRQAGITTAVVAPEPGMLRGVSALVNLGDGGLGDNLLRPRVAQNVSFETRGFREGYPTSLMGAIALLRQSLADAAWYGQAHEAWESDPAQTRPVYNRSLAALEAVAAGTESVVFETESLDNLFRAARLAEELGLDAWYVGTGEEYRHLEPVKALGRPLLVPLDFPETPKVGEEDDLTASLADLRHWHRAPSNPAALADSDLTLAFTSHGLDDVKKIHPHLAKAIEQGLSADEALAAWTTTPAELLGIETIAGTVAVGKMANLVVVDGNLFTDKPEIREVWIDGRRYELKEVKPPEVDPAGVWELNVETGGGPLTVILHVEGEVGSLTGWFEAMGRRVDLSETSVSGKTLNLGWDGATMGMPGPFSMSLQIQGDRLSGGGSGPPGSFSVSGERTSKPGPEGESR